MAGDWLKIEANTPDKPEVFEIATQLSITPEEAFGRLFLVWRWFDQHTENGNAHNVSDSYINRISGVAGFAQAMRSVGWLDMKSDGGLGVSLPKFDRHNGKTAKTRALTAKRVATHKQRNGNAEVTDGALPREEKRRDKNKAPRFALPDWIPADAWRDFEEVRKRKRSPLTDRARQLCVAELQRLRDGGNEPRAVIERAVLKGWLSFYPLSESPAKAAVKVDV